ncbi:MAG: VCBS repeat-containing protein [Planctomycetes bacterium]|nr:VCBS repeat-containing protein [Planctomycetota bacterium]MCW8137112.1 VCBS repeat-containing protein [Planctomycetota bacterium]
MRLVMTGFCLVALCSLVVAQDKPDRVAELEKRVDQLEKDNAELRRRIEALEAKAGQQPRAGTQGVLWTLALKSDQKGSAHVADLDGDGKLEIVFGTYFNEEHLFCVDAATGAIKWKHKSDGGPLDASVAIADVDGDGKLDVLSGDSAYGKLYCLSGDGKLKGIFQLPSGTDSPPAVADLDGDGAIEVIAGSMWQRDGIGAVTCFNGKTREKIWERRIKGCVQSEPVLVDLNGDKVLDVIVTSWRGDRKIHALNGKDGEPLWEFETPGNDKSMGMYHGVAIGGQGDALTIYAATCQGDVYALDAKGKARWHRHVDDYLFAPPTLADLDGDGKDELIFGGRKLYVVRAADGTDVWGPTVVTHALDRGAVVADADGDGKPDVIYFDGVKVLARDGTSGRVVFTFDTLLKGDISSAPIVADFDGDGALDLFFVCGTGTSENRGRDNAGTAYAVKLKGKGEGWRTFRGNLRRTGRQ